MKKLSGEFVHNYKTYSFGYANYCLREKGDKLSEIYRAGYLPYSANPSVKNVFYMARSSRVPLKPWLFTSENRRVARKFDGQLTRLSEPIKDFDISNENFLSFCIRYFSERHGPDIMPRARLLAILNSGLIGKIVSYAKKDMPVAYVLECSDKKMTHFWFSFYDLKLIHQSLGMWLMLDSARFARKHGAGYFYIGTVYSEKALYKTAFGNLEYWDGDKWINDLKKLKTLSRSDSKRTIDLTDVLKKEEWGL